MLVIKDIIFFEITIKSILPQLIINLYLKMNQVKMGDTGEEN